MLEEQKKKEEEKRKKEEEKEKKNQLQLQLQQQQQQQQMKLQNGGAGGEFDDNGTAVLQEMTPPEQPATSAMMKPMKKNFASIDCGAKVISSNAESAGAGNVISQSK